jgi:hypothetical protein
MGSADPGIRLRRSDPAGPGIRRRRKSGGDGLFAYRSGRGWHDATAADINSYLAEISGGEFTAKDFRTWHATVLAAVGLAVSEHAAGSATARKRAIARAVAEVACYLGNTPAVARASYIDPRVIELYESGITIAPALRDLGRNSGFGDLATRGGGGACCGPYAHLPLLKTSRANGARGVYVRGRGKSQGTPSGTAPARPALTRPARAPGPVMLGGPASRVPVA